MNAMVELKHSNMKPVMNLFEGSPNAMNAIFRDLQLVRKGGDPKAKNLIADFRQYQIASLPNVLFAGSVITETPVYFDDTASVEGSDDHRIENQQEVEECGRVGVLEEESSSKVRDDFEAEFRDEIIQCKKCAYHTVDQSLFEAHQRSHFRRETGTCPCRDCSETFPNPKALNKHRAQSHKKHVCDVCGFRTTGKNSLLVHMERHKASGQYQCEFCQKSFNVEQDRFLHIKRMHEKQVTLWKCDTCGLEFKRKSTLEFHELVHQNVFAHLCMQCGSKFKTTMALKRHIFKVHGEKTRACPHCDRKYHEKYALTDHIESSHGIQMRFFCDVCVEWFDSQEKLAIHVVRHSSPKELECGTCLVVFSSQELLSDHLCISYRDDYVCCDEDFRFYKFYNNHMFIKHGTRTNVRVRMKPGQLFGAMRIRRKKVIKCPKCQANFASYAKKFEHMKNCNG
ncbi:zinc finger protein 197 [Culex quinquefasciatus]|uniref:Zinc finger protein 197 n=1 Tax=Culex quinquefasciatus TaxID=7176 RepID=B0WWY9_CULQU|nr:zinc finger protein 197 [Culex quinquefasciatus]|eukprot:XP_001861911.1 zinc finger protein 197 [Culex quinquefasciatus]